MWKAERFEGTETKDPLEVMLDFVNKRGLQPGQFQFSVAADEEGFQYCVMLYQEKPPAAEAPRERPAFRSGEQPARFGAPRPGGRPRTGKPRGERSGPPEGRDRSGPGDRGGYSGPPRRGGNRPPRGKPSGGPRGRGR